MLLGSNDVGLGLQRRPWPCSAACIADGGEARTRGFRLAALAAKNPRKGNQKGACRLEAIAKRKRKNGQIFDLTQPGQIACPDCRHMCACYPPVL